MKYPGVAKVGIALEWGSRGLEFESRHSDQDQKPYGFWSFYLQYMIMFVWRFIVAEWLSLFKRAEKK